MFYEEKLIGDALWCRSTPDGEWCLATTKHAPAVNALLRLTDDERLAAFHLFCVQCGSTNPRCQCWNDE